MLIIRYNAGSIKWTENKLNNQYRKSRKLLTLYYMFHKKGDIDKLYLKRSEVGIGAVKEIF